MIDWIVVGDYCAHLSRIFTHKKRSSHIPGFFYTTPQIITRSYILNNNYTHFHGSRGKKGDKRLICLSLQRNKVDDFSWDHVISRVSSHIQFWKTSLRPTTFLLTFGQFKQFFNKLFPTTVKIYAKYAIFGVHKGYIFSWPCHHKSKPWLFYKKPSRATFTLSLYFSQGRKRRQTHPTILNLVHCTVRKSVLEAVDTFEDV